MKDLQNLILKTLLYQNYKMNLPLFFKQLALLENISHGVKKGIKWKERARRKTMNFIAKCQILSESTLTKTLNFGKQFQ